MICLRSDSFKIALIIYLNYLDVVHDIDSKMLDIILQTIHDSTKYHEMKLFLIHEHLEDLSIEQMNRLLDIY